MRMLLIFNIAIVTCVLFYLSALIYANDFSVPTKPIPPNINNVLTIFPHADDEALSTGGLIYQLSSEGDVHWIVLTEGERGNEGAQYDVSLKAIRRAEARRAGNIYGITTITQKEYPDGEVAAHTSAVAGELTKIISAHQPDLIITFDRAGLYGHPDHIATSVVVTELVKENFPEIKLWYVSSPKRVLDAVSLPEHMAEDPDFKSRRVCPTHKTWVGVDGVLRKIKAVYAYESQRESYKKGLPIRQLPLWFYVSLMPYEYFYEVE